ncbi:hypothetical protein AUK22_10815 [bacterium CG2_30_54_10]|nr:MAG: hypothetical protein AUK22_10815 [bacterium CG2_30_54_10]
MSLQRFSYKALDIRGKPMNGFMDARSQEEVGSWLSDRQYFVLEISLTPLGSLAAMTTRALTISQREMNYFLMQLSSLLNAGCPLIMSLQALHKQLPESNLRSLLKDLKEKIETGKSFSDALKNHPRVFSNLFITMVEVGEIGGILDQILERYAQLYDSMFRIRAKVIKSMIYPIILLVVTIVVAWALLVWVFPNFVKNFEGNGQLLPGPTRFVIAISTVLSTYTWQIAFGVILAFVLFMAFRKSDRGGRILSIIGLGIPFIGALVQHIELALFARTLGTLIKCGVPILTSLGAVERAHSNTVFKEALADIKGGVARGESLSQGLGKHRNIFPDSLILMADVGERSGNTGGMLEKAGQMYERDLETTIDAVVTLIQPLLVIFMGIFVVILALAMYLPLFDLIKMVK